MTAQMKKIFFLIDIIWIIVFLWKFKLVRDMDAIRKYAAISITYFFMKKLASAVLNAKLALMRKG